MAVLQHGSSIVVVVIVIDVIRLRHLNPELPRHLDEIVARLMARDADDRYRRAIDVRAALSGVHVDATDADGTMLVAEPIYVPPDLHDEHDEDDADDDLGSFIRSERSWMLPAVLLVLVGIALVVAGVLFSQSPLADSVADLPGVGEDEPGETSTSNTTVLTPIDEIGEPAPVGAVAIDPEGDGQERDETASLAVDGDSETFWRTERYRSPNFGNLKSGVGLVIDLGGPSVVSEITLTTRSDQWAVQFYVADEFNPDRVDPDAWGPAAAGGEGLSGTQTFSVDERTGRLLLIWITDPGLSADGSDDGDEPDHRFELAEVAVS